MQILFLPGKIKIIDFSTICHFCFGNQGYNTPNDGYYPGCEEDDLSMRRDANMVGMERIALLLTEPHTVLYVKSWRYAWREMSKSTKLMAREKIHAKANTIICTFLACNHVRDT